MNQNLKANWALKKINKTDKEIELEYKEKLNNIIREIDILSNEFTKDGFHPINLSFDEDSNFHIDFIHSAANIRARNYMITEWDQLKTKSVVGKIIPLISTTTSMIVGSAGMEIFKLVQGFDKIDDYRDEWINLASSIFVFSEPNGPKKTKDSEYDPIMLGPIKAIPPNWTSWDLIEIHESKTVQDLINYLKQAYEVKTSMIAWDSKWIYNSYNNDKVNASRLSINIEEIFNEFCPLVEGRNFLILEVSATSYSDEIEASMPKIKYIFR